MSSWLLIRDWASSLPFKKYKNRTKTGGNKMKIEDKSNQNAGNEKLAMQVKEQKARKEGITKGVLITAAAGIVLLVAAGVFAYSYYNREQQKHSNMLEAQRHSFTEQLTERDSMINEWMETFDQIEKDLRTIKEKEKLISLKSSDMEISTDRKKQILQDIAFINTLLEQNKAKIASLNSQLKKSGGVITSLQNRIAELEASMKQSENEIAELKVVLTNKEFEITQLNTRVADMELNIADKEEYILNQTNEMNKAFIASGSFRDLKEKGIVSKEGGFLGIGKKESLMENFSDTLFTAINVTETKTIPVNSKGAKLITEHPTDSYELIHDDSDKIAYIEIKDPIEFWKITRYAVVEIK
jgi:uncharacterized coiled-coil protein SlyX